MQQILQYAGVTFVWLQCLVGWGIEPEGKDPVGKKMEKFLSWQHSWIRSSTAWEVVQEGTAADQAWKPTILPLLKPLKALLPTNVFIAPS